MMTCLKQKNEERAQIEASIADFIAKGGKVKKYKLGESAVKPLRYSRKHNKDRIV